MSNLKDKEHPNQTTIYDVSKTEIDCRYTETSAKKVEPLKKWVQLKTEQLTMQF